GVNSYNLALAYERVGEYKKALDVINKALEQKSPYPSVERLKELRERIQKEMVDHYEKLVESNVNPGVNSYNLALAYERVGEYKKALDVINKALEQKSPYPSVERLKELSEKLQKLVK
ncbi:TPA: tetratricopeptide repeat protein, partial [Clostridium perfringens]